MMNRFIPFLFLAVAACTSAPQPAPISSLFAKVYAMQFVECMRASGIEAGAFEVGEDAGPDGQLRLVIEVHEAGDVRPLILRLEPTTEGARIASSSIGGEPLRLSGNSAWSHLMEWHRDAVTMALAEEGD